ncbi:MAG: MarR family transcriptional regulator [Candidatus Moranbacteria bacterium]|nr:MarR family transcriptional regulator [Candidatus Moranbacteria bacterium]
MKNSGVDREKAGVPTDDVLSPILHAAERIERISDRLVFEPMNLSFSAFKILRLLSGFGPMSPGDMLGMLSGTKSNLSQRLATLEKYGFVNRTPSPAGKDRRYTIFAITPLGKRKLRDVQERAEKEGLRLSQLFSKSEIDGHVAFFRKLLTLLSRTDEEGCPGCDTKRPSAKKQPKHTS